MSPSSPFRPLLPLFLALATTACPGNAKHVPLEMTPIGTSNLVPTDTDEPSKPGEPATKPTSTVTKSDCIASAVDEVANFFTKSDCDADPDAAADMGGRLKVKVVASTPLIAPGGRVDLKVTITNETSEKVPVFFKLDPKPHFEVEATDARGKRVDTPAGKAPKTTKKDEGPARTGRITLMPGGTIKAAVTWDALKHKYVKDGVVSAGPLPLGKYTLKVVTPLVGFRDVAEFGRPTTPIEVGN